MNDNDDRRFKAPPSPVGAGAPSRRWFGQVMDWNVAKGVQTQPALPLPIIATFTAVLDPFKVMAMSVAVAKHLNRRQGRGG